MHEITCPHCHTPFTIDESGYADIVKQVRDREFDQALHDRLELAERETRTAVELAEAKLATTLAADAAARDAEIARLKAEAAASAASTASAQQLAVIAAVSAIEKERDALARDLALKASDVALAEERAAAALKDEAAKKNAEIERLTLQLAAVPPPLPSIDIRNIV